MAGRGGRGRGDWIIVEGQGSLDHPAYSSVTLGLIHGATPHAMVMVHKPGLAEHDFDHLPEASFPIAKLPEFIRLHETVAGLVAPSKVVGVALNTMLYPDEAEARDVVARIAEETGLPTDDPVRFGADGLWAAVHEAVDALPWVARALPVGDPLAPARGPAPRPARPVPDRALGSRRRPRRHDRRRRAARRPVPGPRGPRRGLPGPLLRRDRRDDGRRVPHASRRDRGLRADRRWRPSRGRPAAESRDPLERRRQVRHRHRAPRPGRQGGRPAGPSVARPVGGHPADGLHARAGRAGGRRRAGTPRGLSRPSRSSAAARRTWPRSRRCAPSTTEPIRVDANTGWTPEIARQLLPRLSIWASS